MAEDIVYSGGELRRESGAALTVLTVAGQTGATAASRWAGGTVAGAPVAGTFALGDFILDQRGIVWICTVAGTPGTWVDASSTGRELAAAESAVAQTGIAGTAVDLTGLSVTFTVAARPVWVEVDLPWVSASAAAGAVSVILADEADTVKRYGTRAYSASQAHSMRVVERFSTPGTYTRKAQLQRAGGSATFSNNTLDIPQLVSTIAATEK